MPTERWTVDRIEETVYVMIRDDGRVENVEQSALGNDIPEGSVLDVDATADDSLKWASARLVPHETQRRSDDAESRLQRLRNRDPGGDLDL
jgi:hypothetical protein